ncbi:MAG: polymerase, sigma-24 subunit, subfamily, partial [Bryobacterales bacterium]|nr:polymerase, sigma-24 subunit, subfamily [Bryobacterales bacterium]
MVLQTTADCGFGPCNLFANAFSRVKRTASEPLKAPTLDPDHHSWENGAFQKMAPNGAAAVEATAEVTEEVREELALVDRARTGDGAAFSALIRRYESKIFRLAMNITQNREDAEDVLQEAFLKAYEHLDQIQGNSRIYTWNVRIAVNQSLM